MTESHRRYFGGGFAILLRRIFREICPLTPVRLSAARAAVQRWMWGVAAARLSFSTGSQFTEPGTAR